MLDVTGARSATGVLLTILLLPTTGSAADRHGVDLESLNELFQAELDASREEYGFPGATAAFRLDDGRGASVATGWADVERELPMRPDSVLLAGSVGKSLVAALTLLLDRQNELGLDDKVSRWFGSSETEFWYRFLPNAQDLTIRHLATHRTGLYDHLSGIDIAPYWIEWITTRPQVPPSPEVFVGLSLGKEPAFAAGSEFEYSDTNYLLLGLVLEKVAGEDFYEAVNTRFLEPLGLIGEIVPLDRMDIPDLATGYTSEQYHYMLPSGLRTTTLDGVLSAHPQWEWTGGGFAGTASGFAKWASAFYSGRAMPYDYLDTLLENPGRLGKSRAGFDFGSYTMGAQITPSPEGDVLGHMGSTAGYTGLVFYHPQRRLSISLLVNTDTNPRAYETYQRLRAKLFSALDRER